MKALKILLLIGAVLLGVIITGCNYELVGPWDTVDPNQRDYSQLRHDMSSGHFPTLEGRM